MRVTDLMVGDWVKVRVTNKCRKIAGTNDLLFHNDYDPIPITEEILVKNGFEKTKGGEYKRTRYVMFSDKSWVALYTREAGGYSAFLNKIVVIYYVHQLQHLLLLCGINKDIKL